MRLRRRAEFVQAARGARWNAPAFVLHIAPRPRQPAEALPATGQRVEEPGASVGIGYTVTRKIGSAVVRNRARRRLREAVRQAVDALAVAGCNLVIVARPAALTCPFENLVRDLQEAFRAVPRRLARQR